MKAGAQDECAPHIHRQVAAIFRAAKVQRFQHLQQEQSFQRSRLRQCLCYWQCVTSVQDLFLRMSAGEIDILEADFAAADSFAPMTEFQ